MTTEDATAEATCAAGCHCVAISVDGPAGAVDAVLAQEKARGAADLLAVHRPTVAGPWAVFCANGQVHCWGPYEWKYAREDHARREAARVDGEVAYGRLLWRGCGPHEARPVDAEIEAEARR